jgi:hypothetical protein
VKSTFYKDCEQNEKFSFKRSLCSGDRVHFLRKDIWRKVLSVSPRIEVERSLL